MKNKLPEIDLKDLVHIHEGVPHMEEIKSTVEVKEESAGNQLRRVIKSITFIGLVVFYIILVVKFLIAMWNFI